MAKWIFAAVLALSPMAGYGQYGKPERFHATTSFDIPCDGDVDTSLTCKLMIVSRGGATGTMEITYDHDDRGHLIGHISIKAKDGASDIEWGAPIDKVAAVSGSMIVVFSAFDHKGKPFSGMATLHYKTTGAQITVLQGGVVHLGVL